MSAEAPASTGLALIEETVPASGRSVREVIEALKTATMPEVKEIHDRAIAAEAYAKAKQHRDAYATAGEIKLWAERSAGDIRSRMPRPAQKGRFDRAEARRLREEGLTQERVARAMGVSKTAIAKAESRGWFTVGEAEPFRVNQPLSEFDESLGVSPTTALQWERLARIPEDRFSDLVSDAKKTASALTAAAILSRHDRYGRKRIEPGIYRNADGRVAIKWTKDGVSRWHQFPHGDVDKARKALAKARGKIKETHLHPGRTVGDGYALVRRALATLDRLDVSELDTEGKRAVGDAMAHLHRAEDALVIASQQVGA